MEFVVELREKELVYERITEYLFGFDHKLDKQRMIDHHNRKEGAIDMKNMFQRQD